MVGHILLGGGDYYTRARIFAQCRLGSDIHGHIVLGGRGCSNQKQIFDCSQRLLHIDNRDHIYFPKNTSDASTSRMNF